MTKLEKRAIVLMTLDSGPEDPTWADSSDDARRTYLLQATEERAYAHRMATVMAVRTHGDGVDDTDIDWYRDLVLHALAELDAQDRV